MLGPRLKIFCFKLQPIYHFLKLLVCFYFILSLIFRPLNFSNFINSSSLIPLNTGEPPFPTYIHTHVHRVQALDFHEHLTLISSTAEILYICRDICLCTQ